MLLDEREKMRRKRDENENIPKWNENEKNYFLEVKVEENTSLSFLAGSLLLGCLCFTKYNKKKNIDDD